MTHRGEERTNGIRYRFNPSCGSIFKVQKSAQIPASSDWGKLIRRWGKVFLSGPHPPSATVPPLPEGEGYLLDDGFCDFAFGSAQNDRVGSMLVRVKVLGL